MTVEQNNVMFESNSTGYYYESKWVINNRPEYFKKVIVNCEDIYKMANHFRDWISNEKGKPTMFSESEDIIFIHNHWTFVKIERNNSITEVSIRGSEEDVKNFYDRLYDTYEVMNTYIKWIYDTYNSDIVVPLSMTNAPFNEMYPWLKEPLDSYYDRYLNSDSSILLLIGPPGTGKTTFIKGLINRSNQIARVCYDEELMKRDGLFTDFIDSNDKFFILEDSDTFIAPRETGNNTMLKFLNVGDGLVKTNKKIIFSTNLASTSDIDNALIRPGRCFDIIQFRELDYTESVNMLKVIGSEYEIDKNRKYSVAELFNMQNNREVKKHIGFL